MASYPARPATGNRAVGAPLQLRSAFCKRPANNPWLTGCNTTAMPCRCPLAPCPQQFCHGWRYGRGRAHCERVHAPWWILHKIKKGWLFLPRCCSASVASTPVGCCCDCRCLDGLCHGGRSPRATTAGVPTAGEPPRDIGAHAAVAPAAATWSKPGP